MARSVENPAAVPVADRFGSVEDLVDPRSGQVTVRSVEDPTRPAPAV